MVPVLRLTLNQLIQKLLRLQRPLSNLQLKNQPHQSATINPALLTSRLKTLLSLKRWTNVLRVVDAHQKAVNKYGKLNLPAYRISLWIFAINSRKKSVRLKRLEDFYWILWVIGNRPVNVYRAVTVIAEF